MQKRISALLLAMVIVIGSVLGGNTLKVKAASVAVSEEFAVELTMMLYNLLETVAISSGIKDGLDDYESGSSLYDAFITSVESMAEPPFYDTIITMPDGSKMTVKEAMDAVDSTLGSNALKLPTSETFAKYRVISGTGGNEPDPTPTPSSDPDSTPVPDTGYKDPFSYIQDVLVSSTLLSAMAGIIADLYAGKIDGIDVNNYIDLGFTGKLDQDANGKYILNGYVSDGIYEYLFSSSYEYPVICYVINGSDGIFRGYHNKSFIQVKPTYQLFKNGSLDRTGTVGSFSLSSETYRFNIPIIASEDNSRAFFTTGSQEGH